MHNSNNGPEQPNSCSRPDDGDRDRKPTLTMTMWFQREWGLSKSISAPLSRIYVIIGENWQGFYALPSLYNCSVPIWVNALSLQIHFDKE